MHVVATAGHVDHGKSTLVATLTGTDPDRWAVEKERGLTIDLGFAHLQLPSGRELAFVDVPGHVRFIRNMLAGVGAVDACLFVVAATEGWKPQSEEHLRILQMLGITHGVIALTKVALCDDDLRELARLDVEEHVADTFLADAELVEVDSPTGWGVAELLGALDRLTERTPVALDRGRPRLWVDRAFAAKGSGTVVTGTLAGGEVAADDELTLLPLDARVRVRSLQAHHRVQERLGPGHRAAINLTGVAHADVGRGDVLIRSGQWHLTSMFDAEVAVLASLDHPLSRRGAFVAYVGSGELPVRLRVLGHDALQPGETGAVRLHLPWKVPLLPGDRFVLRESGRGETVGGGEVLDVAPTLPAARARPDRSVERVIAERGWVERDELERLTGEMREPTVGRWVVDPVAFAEARARLADAVAGAGALGLDLSTLDERDRAVVATLEGVVVDAGRVSPAEAEDPLADHPFVAALEAAPFSPPPADGVDRTELRELVRRGVVVAQDGVHFATSAVEEAGREVAHLLREHPGGVTVAQIRDRLGNSRKHALPLVAALDARGVTRRRGDLRIGGPRLPVVDGDPAGATGSP